MLESQKRYGWAGPQNAAREWDKLAHLFIPFGIRGAVGASDGKRVVLWEAVRELLGKDLPNIPQEIGDCVSFGMASAIDHLSAWEIVRLRQPEKFRKAFQPYVYGVSRVQIGGGKLGNGDGSLGSWAALGVQKHGILAADEPGAPSYSGSIAKTWGRSGPPKQYLDIAKKNLVKSAAPIKSYEQARDALCNGYALTYATNRGHSMQLKLDPVTGKGWHQGVDTWPHQRCIIGVDDDPKRPGVFIWNSWGPTAHTPNNDGPPGGGWFDADDFDKDVRKSGTECYALSMFDGFPGEAQKPSFLLI